MSLANELATKFMEHRMKQVDIPVLEGWFNLMVPEGILRPEPRFKVLQASRIESLEDILNHSVGYKFLGILDHPSTFCILMERENDGNNKENPQVLNSTEGASEAGQQGLFIKEV